VPILPNLPETRKPAPLKRRLLARRGWGSASDPAVHPETGSNGPRGKRSREGILPEQVPRFAQNLSKACWMKKGQALTVSRVYISSFDPRGNTQRPEARRFSE